jgi:hypothetical protein
MLISTSINIKNEVNPINPIFMLININRRSENARSDSFGSL